MLPPGFTGGTLDRADRIRHEQALAAAMADPRARLLRLTALDPELDAQGRLVWDSMAFAPDDADLLFLGFDAGIPCFAARQPAEPPVKGRSMTIMFGCSTRSMPKTPRSMPPRAAWSIGTCATGFCAVCGTPTHVYPRRLGPQMPQLRRRAFPARRSGGDHDRRIRGQGTARPRQGPGRRAAIRRWPASSSPANRSRKQCARETLEEAGVVVRDVRYIASQPWPFPSSLMIACIGTAESDAVTIDATELEGAIWVTREEARAALAGEPAPFVAPPPYAIAYTLLTEWAGQD
jgi:NAD+ diphosphatase